MKFWKNLQENTCARVSFLIKFKKETLAQVFSFKFYEIYENTYLTEHLWTTASEFTTFSRVQICLISSIILDFHSTFLFFDKMQEAIRICPGSFRKFNRKLEWWIPYLKRDSNTDTLKKVFPRFSEHVSCRTCRAPARIFSNIRIFCCISISTKWDSSKQLPRVILLSLHAPCI